MIAQVSLLPRSTNALAPSAQDKFVEMIPAIERVAKFAFRHERGARCQELVAEVVASAFVMFSRLVADGKADLAYPTVLGRFAVRKVRSGRQVGTRMNIDDVSSSRCQRHQGVRMTPLQRFEPAEGKWLELIVEDRRATPADLAVTRIDFSAWLRRLPSRQRKLAKLLAAGEPAWAVAQRFQILQGRISQLRRALQASWEEFQGERLVSVA